MNDALEQLYKQHAAALRLYARTWCRSPDDALQEAMIELARQPELPSQPVAWLYRAVRYRAMNLHRGEQRRREREQAAVDQREPFFVEHPETPIDVTSLELALQRLAEQDREIVIARIWGGLSFEQIADLTNCSSSSVHRHYHASLKKLKQYMDETSSISLKRESS